MKAAVLDTSVILKWYHREDEADVAAALLLRDAYLNGILAITVPDLLVYEFANALWSKANLAPALIDAAVQSLWGLGLDVVPLQPSLSQRMVALSRRRNITVYDAAFVALAQEAGAAFITADAALYKKVREEHESLLLSEVAGI